MNSVTYSSSNPFSTINDISIYITSVFFKDACHANPDSVIKREDQVHIFQDTYC